ncbi:MAG: arsenate reductase ArsC [Desulfonauticus sp.]|nr:arsenate reductase ArsC [Desulfonauticus sp.]
MKKTKILFLCTGNSCRSQMAEGFTKFFWSNFINPKSAGIRKYEVDPLAIKVMKEEGIDISNNYSKTIQELEEKEFDYVITLCDHARETCPYFPGKILHKGFPDPPYLTSQLTNIEDKLKVYRKVRNQIKDFILKLPQHLRLIS